MSAERCEWIDDPEIGLWYLPVCWGAVIGGPECCYCDLVRPSADDRITALEEEIKKLSALLARREDVSQPRQDHSGNATNGEAVGRPDPRNPT